MLCQFPAPLSRRRSQLHRPKVHLDGNKEPLNLPHICNQSNKLYVLLYCHLFGSILKRYRAELTVLETIGKLGARCHLREGEYLAIVVGWWGSMQKDQVRIVRGDGRLALHGSVHDCDLKFSIALIERLSAYHGRAHPPIVPSHLALFVAPIALILYSQVLDSISVAHIRIQPSLVRSCLPTTLIHTHLILSTSVTIRVGEKMLASPAYAALR